MVLTIGLFAAFAAGAVGCCGPAVITYKDGAQAVSVDGRWWSKPVNGRAMFLMPAGWVPEAYR